MLNVGLRGFPSRTPTLFVWSSHIVPVRDRSSVFMCIQLVSEFCKLDLTCPVPGCAQQETRILLLEGALKLKDKDSKVDGTLLRGHPSRQHYGSCPSVRLSVHRRVIDTVSHFKPHSARTGTVFSQLSAAVVRHKANDGVVYAIRSWLKYDTALSAVV